MRFSLIDLFRGVAISLVVFYHVNQEIFLNLTHDFINIGGVYRFNAGSFGVFLFILLSGLSLGLKYKNQEIDYKKFIVKRFLRIYPAYFIALTIGIIIYFAVPKEILNLAYYYQPVWGFSDFICSFTGFCHFLSRIGGPFLGTGWFLGIIIPFYLLFPFLFKKFKANPLTLLFIAFLISLIYQYIERYIPAFNLPLLGLWPLPHLFEFGLGIYLALTVKKSFWLSLNKFRNFSRLISWAGILSFPIFLVHHPLLFIINYLNQKNICNCLSVFIYLIITLILSGLVFYLTKKITSQRQEIN